MKRFVLVSIIAAGPFSVSYGQPVQDMSPHSVAIDYSGLWRGEDITQKEIGAHENVQLLKVNYAPVQYCMAFAGLGMSSYSVDTVNHSQFKGGWGFTPSLGASFFSPYLVPGLLRIAGGLSFYYLYSQSRDRSYLYQGSILDPRLGAVFSLGGNADLEIGGRGLFIFGSMQKGSDAGLAFSNKERARGYVSLMLHTPSEGGYCIIDFNASPNLSMDWSGGPVESGIGLTLGCVLRTDWHRGKSGSQNEPDFPGFEKIKKKEKEMKKEIE